MIQKKGVNLKEFFKKRNSRAKTKSQISLHMSKSEEESEKPSTISGETTQKSIVEVIIREPKAANKQQISGNKKDAEYLRFIEWIALPSIERIPKTQKELAKQLKVDEGTLSDWRNRPGFWNTVEQKTNKWARAKTPNVIQSLYEHIMDSKKIAGKDVLVWLQYTQKFDSNSSVGEETPIREFTPEQAKQIEQALTHIGLASIIAKDREGYKEINEGVEKYE